MSSASSGKREMPILAVTMSSSSEIQKGWERFEKIRRAIGRRRSAEDHQELVAAQTAERAAGCVETGNGEEIAGANRLLESSGHRLQQDITRSMTQGIVDLLEAVETHVKDRARNQLDAGPAQDPAQMIEIADLPIALLE
jgi:DNA-binding helix-hairpin-helix protein with protein kinase domain